MKKIIHIKGMHCISCEIILEKEIKQISGVKIIMLSHKKGIMEVNYNHEKDYNKIKEAIEKHGFKVVLKNQKNGITLNIILNNIALFLGIAVFVYLFSMIDIYKYLPDTSTLSYSGAFLIGIIASVSTCLAITGGIIIGFARYIDNEKGIYGHIKVQGLFQLGRIIGFFILGGTLGYIGNIFQISFGLTGIVTFIVGFLLLYMGLNIIGIFPSITKFGLHLPKNFANKIESLGNPKFSPFVGALTFFLPCGFTQTLQLLAISSGSFFAGGLVMMFFAIGTFPVLFSVGLGSSYFKEKKFTSLNNIIGVIVIIFGLFTISNSYNLLSVGNEYFRFSEIEVTEIYEENINENENISVSSIPEIETINISHNGWSTEPSVLKLKKGGNYKIIITPSSNGLGCMGTQVIPKLSNNVSYVKKGIPIVYEMQNAKPGSYDIVCASMGMKQGKIVVE